VAELSARFLLALTKKYVFWSDLLIKFYSHVTLGLINKKFSHFSCPNTPYMRAVAVIKTGSAFDFALSAYQKDRELYLGTKLSALEKWFGFCCMKRLGVFLLPPDGMQVHRRSLPCNLLGFQNNSAVPIYTPGWSEALRELSVVPKNTIQCPRLGFKPGTLVPESSGPTMRPPRKLFGQNLSDGMTSRKRGLAAEYCSKWRQQWLLWRWISQRKPAL